MLHTPRRRASICLLLVFIIRFPAFAEDGKPADNMANEGPARVISMSPPITEILFEIGAGDKIVGVSDFCHYPPETQGLERCGGYINPNFEVMLSLQPDLVVIQGEHTAVREFCENHSIDIASVKLEGIEGILGDIETLGEAMGKETEARATAERMREALRAFQEAAPPVSERPIVFLSLSRTPGALGNLFSAGRGSFLDEILEYAGGRNVLADLDILYPQVSAEALVERAPEMILEIAPNVEFTADQKATMIADWDDLSLLPAVADDKIFILNQDFLVVPGPRLTQTIAAIRTVLHPEAEPVVIPSANVESVAPTP